MSSKQQLEMIRNRVKTTSQLDDAQKSDSMKRIEEWALEDRAFGILKAELLEVSAFFEEIFSELGIK
jgi:hypothetical protein